MTKLAALCASALILASCATPFSPDVETPATVQCDPRLLSPIKAEPPVEGTIVQPATDQERADTAAFLQGEAAARDWGREGWRRAAIAKAECEARPR